MPKHPNVRRFLDLSTAHLSPKTRDHWTLNPDAVPAPGGVTRYGFFVWSGMEGDEPDDDALAEVTACQRFARSLGCDFILFDADADTVEGLEVFDDE